MPAPHDPVDYRANILTKLLDIDQIQNHPIDASKLIDIADRLTNFVLYGNNPKADTILQALNSNDDTVISALDQLEVAMKLAQ